MPPMGMPAAKAFCMISNEARPLDQDHIAERAALIEQRAADRLVDGIMPSDVFADDQERR